ncbi:MAG: hypothetical protein WC965_13470 [Thiohalomonadaceae bacterium]
MSASKQVGQPVDLQPILDRFIELANDIKDEGIPIEMVNAGLMLASCTYATYIGAGNEGYLKEAGVNKVAEVYKKNLAGVQKIKKNQLNPQEKK